MDSQGESDRFDAPKSLDPVGIFGKKNRVPTFHTPPLRMGGRESSKLPENPTFANISINM
jgi:hypothetical protein